MVDGKKLRPFSDKLFLREIPDEEGVIALGSDVQALVVAVGPGIPYGRGEYYSPSAREGMVVIVPRKAWAEAGTLRWGRDLLRVVHERECYGSIEEA